MQSVAIVGAQWGDEGKGKITDFFAEKADFIVRCTGGPNAGHTIYDARGNKIVFHTMPSGALYPDKVNCVGNGVVLDPMVFCDEMKAVENAGHSLGRLVIDECAHVIMPWHRLLDGAEEAARTKKIGTTKRGIGPAYMTKAERTTAIRFADFADEKRLAARLDEIVPVMAKKLEAAGVVVPPEWKRELLAELAPLSKKLSGFKGNVPAVLNRALDEKKAVLFEGAQGTLLDMDHGTYPFVTSSNASVGGCVTGSGVGPKRIEKIIGVAKAYVTRVGAGPFPTEMDDEVGGVIRERGKEFGATTGRPRRCGWPDLVVLKYAAQVNSLSSLAITKLDILDSVDPLKVCVGYEVGGSVTDVFPRDIAVLEKARPEFVELEGWEKQDWDGIRTFGQMPKQAQAFIKLVEEKTRTPVGLVSVGPGREQTILK